MTTVTDQAINILENTAAILQKTQINWKKCPKERMTPGYLDSRIKMLEGYWTTFKNAHETLVKNTTRDQRGTMSYFVNEEFFIQEEIYLCLHGDIKDMLASKARASESPNVHHFGSVSIEDSCCSQVRLPPIKIPIFTGKYEEWTTFHDLFNTLVHSSSLSQVQKLYYLKTSLSGEAATILNHIQVSDDNYAQAWDMLKHRYGNKRLIVNSLLKRIFNQKKLSTQNANQLKLLLDSTTECLNHLENLKISTDSWHLLIIFLVVQKLDPESHKQWEEYAYKHHSEEMPTWDSLKKFLESKFRTLELTSPSASRDKPVKERTCHVAATATTSPSKEKTCVLCKENHTLSHCKEFIKLTPVERSDYLKGNNLCYNCMAPFHAANQCRLRVTCHICKKRHHSLVHRSKNDDTSVKAASIPPEASYHCVEEKRNAIIASHQSSTKEFSTGTALLATASVIARNEQNHTVVLRALVDPGSQSAFITEKAAQMLKLTKQKAKGRIIGVGSTRTKVNHAVRLEIVSHYDSDFIMNINAYVMCNQLTTTIPSQPVLIKNWKHLEGLKLADPSYHIPGQIDLLLGVKEYAQIVQQSLIRGPPGSPCAQETSLGWILFGEFDTNLLEKSILVLHHQVHIKKKAEKEITFKQDKNKKHMRKNNFIWKYTYQKTPTGKAYLPYSEENPENLKEIKKKQNISTKKKRNNTKGIKNNTK